MKTHIADTQIIKQNGKPAFAVIPYDVFLKITGVTGEEQSIPHEVVGLAVKNDWNLLKSWRKHLGLSQKYLADNAGISQSALSQMEKSTNLRDATIEKLAHAMGLHPEQLSDK
ncbi:MAG: helix-turn-helix transcriptional regulator [bacterium]|nr:helix-turn-helix transcriptional regulator [bacterium]